MLRTKIYVCPVCGNVIHSVGEALVSCHGIQLPILTAELPDQEHPIQVSRVEDEYYIEIDHAMDKSHYISFILGVSENGIQFVKLYPEGKAEARLKISHTKSIYYYCNRDGLFQRKLSSTRS